jgi:hypothetical protein
MKQTYNFRSCATTAPSLPIDPMPPTVLPSSSKSLPRSLRTPPATASVATLLDRSIWQSFFILYDSSEKSNRIVSVLHLPGKTSTRARYSALNSHEHRVVERISASKSRSRRVAFMRSKNLKKCLACRSSRQNRCRFPFSHIRALRPSNVTFWILVLKMSRFGHGRCRSGLFAKSHRMSLSLVCRKRHVR